MLKRIDMQDTYSKINEQTKKLLKGIAIAVITLLCGMNAIAQHVTITYGDSAATYNTTIPCGASNVVARAWGGGGGGGGIYSGGGAHAQAGGGGGGGYVIKDYGIASGNIKIVVGLGGARGENNNYSNNIDAAHGKEGGLSSVLLNGTTITANGGKRGTRGCHKSAVNSNEPGSGGAGGTTSGGDGGSTTGQNGGVSEGGKSENGGARTSQPSDGNKAIQGNYPGGGGSGSRDGCFACAQPGARGANGRAIVSFNLSLAITIVSSLTDYCEGGTLTLRVTDSCSNSYTWKRNGVTVGTGRTLTISNLALTDTGSYTVELNIGNHTYAGSKTTITTSGLPTGISWNNSTKTLSGTLKSSAVQVNVHPKPEITLTSTSPTASQTICQNSAITNITYSLTGGATGATVTGLPTGVSAGVVSGVLTISGTPTAYGPFKYKISTTGHTSPCVAAIDSGTITVNQESILTLTSAPGTDAQTVCNNTAITSITYLLSGSATDTASITGLPPGVTAQYVSGTKTLTLSGTPTDTGTFNYTITTTGHISPCVAATLSGSIIVRLVPNIAHKTVAVCTGSPFTVTTGGSDVAGTSYTWTVSPHPSISDCHPQTTGVSNLPNHTPQLLSTESQYRPVTYTVTPSIGTCTGSNFDIEVRVLPIPIILGTGKDRNICSGTPFTIDVSGDINPAGSVYSWTVSGANTDISGHTDRTDSSALPSHTLINSTTTNKTVKYTIIPKYVHTSPSHTCTGTSFEVNITVYALSTSADATITPTEICHDEKAKIIFTGVPPFTLSYQVNTQSPSVFALPTKFSTTPSSGEGTLTSTGSPNEYKAEIQAGQAGSFEFKLTKIVDGNGCETTF